jgi:indole-3-glycerol phosphate synthase
MQSTIEKILEHKKKEVEGLKANRPLSTIQILAEENPPPLDLGIALLSMSDRPIRIIAECRKFSPYSPFKVKHYQPSVIAANFAKGGAAAVSIHTDEKFYGGTLYDLTSVKEISSVPILRNDFIIDEYQVFESRAAGADSFVLQAEYLDLAQLQYFIELGRELNMEPLVEFHTEGQLETTLKTDAKIICFNRRNLDTGTLHETSAKNIYHRIKKSPGQRLLVCQSGVRNSSDIKEMSKFGYKSFLISESLLSESNHSKAIAKLL